MNKTDAEEFTQSLGQIVSGSWRQIALAKRLGVPKALELSTEDWVNNHLGGYVKMCIDDRRKAVAELTEEGHSTRDIGAVLGVTNATVSHDLKAVKNLTPADPKPNPIANHDDEAVKNLTPVDAVAALAVDYGKIKQSHQHITSSESVEWYTPPRYIEAARSVMGSIDLDPATCEAANQIVKAETYYTQADDGLTKAWAGRVWMNPPYGSACAAFIKKLLDEYKAGRVVEAVILVNSNSNDTEWFRPLWDHVLCFSYGRVNFWNETEQENGPTHGSCFVYLGENDQKFNAKFSEFGAVVRRA